jgi:4-amino-4-deoxy-L-arabinose transferase-like glycosyltransferase
MTSGIRSALGLTAVMLLFGAPLFVGLGRSDLQNDEAIYSYAVDRILETGQWLTPRSINNDGPFFEKPPLKLWLTAVPIRVGLVAHDEFGLRFVDAVFGAIAFVYVFALGRWLGGAVCGFVGSLVLFTLEPLVFDHGFRSNNMDAALVLSYCGGIYHFARWTESDRGRSHPGHAMAVAAYFVLGFMSKFVAELFLPLVCGVAILVRPGGWQRIRAGWREWILPGLAVAVATIPWFAYEASRSSLFWGVLVEQHVYERFTGALDPTHLRPWNFYYAQTWTELMRAGSAAIVATGLLGLAFAAWRHRSWPARLMLVWALLPMALISAGTSKIFHYAYPFLPPLALAAGFASAAFLRALDGPTAAPILDWLRRHAPQYDPASRVLGLVRAALFIGGALACVIGVLTFMRGGTLYWHIGGTSLLRNASLAKPALAAALMFWLGGHLPLVFRSATIILLAAILPTWSYRPLLDRMTIVRNPLMAARDCAIAVRASSTNLGNGVYDAGSRVVYHSYYYYLRHLGRWTEAEHPEPNELRRRLSGPGLQTPVVMSRPDYDALEPMETPAVQRPVGVAPEGGIVILLPGPFEACVAPVVAAGGARVPEDPQDGSGS